MKNIKTLSPQVRRGGDIVSIGLLPITDNDLAYVNRDKKYYGLLAKLLYNTSNNAIFIQQNYYGRHYFYRVSYPNVTGMGPIDKTISYWAGYGYYTAFMPVFMVNQ